MKKTLEWWGSRGYLFRPTISFVLSTHNLSEHAIRIAKDLRRFQDAEIIIIDDGSSHDHTKAIVDCLDGVNEFVLHFNDLFDVIVFNRAFCFARGKYIVVLQDDDDYKGDAWVTRALQIFEDKPRLAVLGGRNSVTIFDGSKPQVESRKGIFQYAQTVNAAPMWFRKDVFMELCGFDSDFAPMLWHEGSFCLKVWLSGYHVGWYESMVDICAIRTGLRRVAKRDIENSSTAKNYKLLIKKFGDRLGDVHKMMELAGK